MILVLSRGERHKQPVLPPLMKRDPVNWPGRGRPRVRPERVAGDKGYSSPTWRGYLGERRIGAFIPARAADIPDPACDPDASRERTDVERLITRLTTWRRIATRSEQQAGNA
jgi:transposase